MRYKSSGNDFGKNDDSNGVIMNLDRRICFVFVVARKEKYIFKKILIEELNFFIYEKY